MKLCLYSTSNEPMGELQMQRSGDVWHIEVLQCPLEGIQYGVRVFGEGGWETGHRWDSRRVLLDPYAPLVASRKQWAQRDDIESFVPKVCHISRKLQSVCAQELQAACDSGSL